MSCNVKSGTTPMNFCAMFHLNPLVYLALWMDLSPLRDCALAIWKNWFAISCSSKFWCISLYNIQTPHFLVSPPCSAAKSWSIEKQCSPWQKAPELTSGLKIQIFTWRFEFLSLATTLLLVILEVTGSSCSFFEKTPVKEQVWSLLGTLLLKNGVPWEKWQVQFAHVLFLETITMLHCAAEAIYSYLTFLHIKY